MKKIFSLLFIISLFITSCSREPQPISYGSDACEFCRMTISDKKFGSEFVTKKGKVYKFDSIECMVEYLHANHIVQDQLARILVSDYARPDHFIEAPDAIYLKSADLISPMGKGLAAFKTMEEMEKVKQQFGGQNYSWDELLKIVR